MTEPRPLAGLTVVEVGNFIAAPFAAMQLADLGADVIKVERTTGGDATRGAGPFVGGHSAVFARLNRNKKCVALDLSAPPGQDAFLRIVDRADILLENLRPGAMANLGLDYPTLSRRNPRLIYASVTGWGRTGPYADLPGLDVMAQARSGLMSVTGSEASGPVKAGVPICDLTAALYLALAVTAAVRHRERTGHGDHVDVSLYESAISLAVWEAASFFTSGDVGGLHGTSHQSMAPYQAVKTSDGMVTVGAVTPRTWDAFCSALDLHNLNSDPRFAETHDRYLHRDVLIELIEARTGTISTAELIRRLESALVPCAPVCDYEAVFTDDHLNADGFFWDAPHPDAGSVRQIGSPMRFASGPVRQEWAGPPLGADSRAVLEWAGYSPADVDVLIASAVAAEPRVDDELPS